MCLCARIKARAFIYSGYADLVCVCTHQYLQKMCKNCYIKYNNSVRLICLSVLIILITSASCQKSRCQSAVFEHICIFSLCDCACVLSSSQILYGHFWCYWGFLFSFFLERRVNSWSGHVVRLLQFHNITSNNVVFQFYG